MRSGGSGKRLGLALVLAASIVATAVALPGSAAAGLNQIRNLYDADAVAIPNGHGAAKMSFDTGPSTRVVDSVIANFRVRHDRTQQLKLQLKGPNGDTVLLDDGETRGENLGRQACSPDEFNAAEYTGFKDSASEDVEEGTAPYVGEWLPDAPLATFSGASPEGEWTLIARDTNPAGDKGKLLCGLIEIGLPPN